MKILFYFITWHFDPVSGIRFAN